MCKVKWLEIDIEDELCCLEVLFLILLYMNFDDEIEYSVVMDLISMLLFCVCELKVVSEVIYV